MKCVKQNGEIKRISDEAAMVAVKAGKAVYVAKKEWKDQGKPNTTVTEPKQAKIKKAKKVKTPKD